MRLRHAVTVQTIHYPVVGYLRNRAANGVYVGVSLLTKKAFQALKT
jgi:hypothetical protein